MWKVFDQSQNSTVIGIAPIPRLPILRRLLPDLCGLSNFVCQLEDIQPGDIWRRITSREPKFVFPDEIPSLAPQRGPKSSFAHNDTRTMSFSHQFYSERSTKHIRLSSIHVLTHSSKGLPSSISRTQSGSAVERTPVDTDRLTWAGSQCKHPPLLADVVCPHRQRTRERPRE